MDDQRRFPGKVIFKHKKEKDWLAEKPLYVPYDGEIVIFDIDENYSNKRLKIGDGVNNIEDLPFGSGSSADVMGGSGEYSIEQFNANASGNNSAAFGISAKVLKDGTQILDTSVAVNRGFKYADKSQSLDKIEEYILTYGVNAPGEGSTGDTTEVEEPDIQNVKTYKDKYIIQSTYDIEFKTTGAVGENSITSGEENLAAGKNSRAFGYHSYAGADYASVEGALNIAVGEDSHAEGLRNLSMGQASHTEGMRNTAEGKNSHIEGLKNATTANAQCSHVEGSYNHCRASNAHMEGMWNVTVGSASHAHVEGFENTTNAIDSHTEGYGNKIEGAVQSEYYGKTYYAQGAHVEGRNNTITAQVITHTGAFSHVEGCDNKTIGIGTHVEGKNNIAEANYAHIEGYDNKINVGSWDTYGGDDIYSGADGSHIEGAHNIIVGGDVFSEEEWAIHVEGLNNTSKYAQYSHVEGAHNMVEANGGHAEGYYNIVKGIHSHTEGEHTVCIGIAAHAEGNGSVAQGDYSHVEGKHLQCTENDGSYVFSPTVNTNATYGHLTGIATETTILPSKEKVPTTSTGARGAYAHAEGNQTIAYGGSSHAEGFKSYAKGTYSHAEGQTNFAEGVASHAEGNLTTAKGDYSHSEGQKTVARGMYSHVEGQNTIATADCQHVQGRFNLVDDYVDPDNGTIGRYIHIVGCGTADGKRANAHTIDKQGNAWFAGNVACTGIQIGNTIFTEQQL